MVLCSGERDLEVVCDMLPVTVSPGVFKTLNDRQSEFNKKCEAIKQIFMDHKSNSWSPRGLRWTQRRLWNLSF